MGLGKAIDYFTSHGIPVSIPLNDTQKYDLIADFNGGLQRISVKTSRYTKNGISWYVLLKNCGGSSGKTIIREFDKTSCDYVFIYTGNNDLYLIPTTSIVSTNAITVGLKYTEYKVEPRTLEQYAQEI